MNSIFFKKELAGIIFFVMLANFIIGGVLLPYQQAQAVLSLLPAQILSYVADAIKYAWENKQKIWDSIQTGLQTAYQGTLEYLGISKEVQDAIAKALKVIGEALKKKLLDMMADQVIAWINGGGKPTFVTDWRAFLLKAADDVGGNFISEYLGAKFLCTTFSPQIQLMLAKPQTFNTAAVCTLSKIGNNIQNFYNNFTTGGWKGWLTVSETQNNIYGMYFYALDQKWSAEQLAAKTGSTAAASAAGFLGDQVCLRYYKFLPDGEGELEKVFQTKEAPKKGAAPAPFTDANCTEWFTRTPGKVAADSLSKMVGKEYDWLLQSDDYSKYIVGIADAVINRTIKEGIALMVTPNANANSSSFTINYSTVMAGIADYQDAAQNRPYVDKLIPQEKLLKENLGNILKEYQTNLNVLTQIKMVQNDAFNTLKNIAQEGCSLPGGASQQNLGTNTTGNCGANTCPCEEKTVETIKVTAPSFGEATFQTTTNTKYAMDSESNICSQTSMAQTSSVALGSLSIDADLTATNNAISKIQTQTGLIDTAVIDLNGYQKTIDDYNTAYDASQAEGTKATTSTISAMYSAKQKAIGSTQAVINSPTKTLNDLLQEIMSASKDSATANNNAVTTRGMDMSNLGDCLNSTGYYKTLCDIQAIKSSWDSAYNSCLNWKNNNN